MEVYFTCDYYEKKIKNYTEEKRNKAKNYSQNICELIKFTFIQSEWSSHLQHSHQMDMEKESKSKSKSIRCFMMINGVFLHNFFFPFDKLEHFLRMKWCNFQERNIKWARNIVFQNITIQWKCMSRYLIQYSNEWNIYPVLYYYYYYFFSIFFRKTFCCISLS